MLVNGYTDSSPTGGTLVIQGILCMIGEIPVWILIVLVSYSLCGSELVISCNFLGLKHLS